MSNDTVRSNLEFINDKMNNIQNKISSSTEVSAGRHTVNSSKDNNMLYSKMNDMVNKYSKTQTELMEKLKYETNFIKSVGEKYYELDQRIKNEVDKI